MECLLRSLLVLLLVVRLAKASWEDHGLPQVSQEKRPVIYTFFERISAENRFTDMDDKDEDNLLQFWKLAWSLAGWEPRILTRADAMDHPEYEVFLRNLTLLNLDNLGEISFMKHFVMGAVGGGFLSDFDSFPISDFRRDGVVLPFDGAFTIYDIFAVNLASGSAEAWIEISKGLVEDARKYVRTNQTSFWTDTLGLLNLFRSNQFRIISKREVLSGTKALSGIDMTVEQCDKRPFRGKRTLHISPASMITGDMEPDLRLPRHRVTIARKWLPIFNKVCLNQIVDFS